MKVSFEELTVKNANTGEETSIGNFSFEGELSEFETVIEKLLTKKEE